MLQLRKQISKRTVYLIGGGMVLGICILFIVLQFQQFNRSYNYEWSVPKVGNTTVSVSTAVPEPLRTLLQDYIFETEGFEQRNELDGTDVNISLKYPGQVHERDAIIHTYYFVPVVPITSFQENISDKKLMEVFSGKDAKQNGVYVREDQPRLEHVFSAELSATEVTEYGDIFSETEKNRVAVVPFDKLRPEWKVLRVNGQRIVGPQFDGEKWPLKVFVVVSSKNVLQSGAQKQFVEDVKAIVPESNRDESRLTTVAMTGVTAISRGVEDAITRHGDPIYPARGVMDVLSKADITHVNSENPLFEGCEPKREGIILCGKERSIQSLEAIGTDVVGLTGNHRNDYGPEKNRESLNNLREAGIEYYGGGRNENEAQKPLFKKVNGTTFAFIGYNYFDSLNGPQYPSLAYEDRPGANYYSEEKMEKDIKNARKKADVVIVEFQFIETYSYEPLVDQVTVFRNAVDVGADIVVGVQAHQPQRVEYYEDGVIFYGLGNFFFDQMWSKETRQGIIPWMTFYDGKLINAYLYTTLLHDYAQPQFVEGKERQYILQEVLPVPPAAMIPTPTPTSLPTPTPTPKTEKT